MEVTFILRACLPHSLFHSHNNQLFPCVFRKFPTRFMVTLNNLIICLHISKTDFAQQILSFESLRVIQLRLLLFSDGLLRKKNCWYQLKSTTDFTPRGMCFDVGTYHGELVKHAHSL